MVSKKETTPKGSNKFEFNPGGFRVCFDRNRRLSPTAIHMDPLRGFVLLHGLGFWVKIRLGEDRGEGKK